jgi:outer membrane protein
VYSRYVGVLTAGVTLLLLTSAGAVRAQQPATLSLEEAVSLARKNNPDYLAQLNNEGDADWAVRAAYGALLPSASLNGGLQYQASGPALYGSLTGADIGMARSPSYYFSNYSIGLGYRLSGATFFNVGQKKADRRATEANVQAAALSLETAVKGQYLAVLRARDAVELAQQELQSAEENMKLAQARVEVGSAIELEAQQAEVQRGRAEVNLLQAETQLKGEKLNLMQQIGVELNTDVKLTTEFPVFEPTWSTDSLVQMALANHPQLHAAEATADAAKAGVRMAKMAYYPSLSLSAGWSGFTRQVGDPQYLINQARSQVQSARQTCELSLQIASLFTTPPPGLPTDCSNYVLTQADEQQILDANRVWPFKFEHQPFSAQLQISLPIFQGLSRQRQVEAARVAREDAQYRLHAEQLQLKTQVQSAYLTLQAAYRAVGMEKKNSDVADKQLQLAREQYRVGSSSFVDLMQAETLKAQADQSYLLAVYAYQDALSALDSAVGKPLRDEGSSR